MTTQKEAEDLLQRIYTPEKKKIWDREMEPMGDKFEADEITWEEYLDFRRKLRKRLGYPA